MNTKLLKRMRKRFHWYMDGGDCWTFYDRKTNSVHYAFVLGMYYINDMLILSLLKRMCFDIYFKRLDDRIEQRQRVKYESELKAKFNQHFK